MSFRCVGRCRSCADPFQCLTAVFAAAGAVTKHDGASERRCVVDCLVRFRCVSCHDYPNRRPICEVPHAGAKRGVIWPSVAPSKASHVGMPVVLERIRFRSMVNPKRHEDCSHTNLMNGLGLGQPVRDDGSLVAIVYALHAGHHLVLHAYACISGQLATPSSMAARSCRPRQRSTDGHQKEGYGCTSATWL